MSSRRPFRCELCREGPETVRVVAVGELDMATAPQLESELATVGHREVILDLRQLEFMDSTGLHTILSLHHSLRDNGRQLKLIKGPLQIQRIFDLTGFTSRLEFLPG